MLYVVLIDVHGLDVKLHLRGTKEKVLVSLAFTTTFILWVFELIQIKNRLYIDGIDGYIEYVTDVTNWFDIAGQVFMFAYCIMFFADVEDEYIRTSCYSIAAFFTNTRLLFHFQVFSTSFRFMLTILVNACMELFYFVFILYAFVSIFSLSDFLVNEDKKLSKTMASTYQLMFGENIGDLDEQKMPI